MEILIPLKLKHNNPNFRILHGPQDPPEGTKTFSGGRFKATTSNSGKANNIKSLKPRRRAYGPW